VYDVLFGCILPVAYTGEHELIEELFEQIKPGLSAYASNPRQVNCLFRHIILVQFIYYLNLYFDLSA